jgi:hypothetical protein
VGDEVLEWYLEKRGLEIPLTRTLCGVSLKHIHPAALGRECRLATPTPERGKNAHRLRLG